ncbi:hypothetical protein DDE83_001340 [Stemphylium lycopersici]|uniref:C3H1-type domain-containing protein n=1 Tax=Stemphylium lycopersici TaxID=183478 RepID=A0A364NDE6_STELY|nr:hypothetical protein DDE83_001340 [Stemphylium lycopersici]
MSALPCLSHKAMLPGAPPEASYPTPASQSSTPSGKSLNTSSSPTPYSDENRALKSQADELERAKRSLIKQAADAEARTAIANNRAYQAEKRAAAADLETKAAIQRAQNRYTEKLHANNESRKLREAIEARDIHLRGYRVSVQSALCNQKARIAHLQNEKMVGDWTKERDTKIGILEEQLGEMQRGFLSAQKEKTIIKAQSDKSIHDLQAVIIRLQSSLTQEQEKKRIATEDLQDQIDSAKADAHKEMTAKLESKICAIEVKFKAREQELMQQTQVKLRDAESHWGRKDQIARKKVALLESQLKDAQRQAEIREDQFQIAALAMQNSSQMFAVQQHQQVSPRQGFSPNKRKRVRSTSSADSSTYALASNDIAMTPKSIKDFEGCIPMSNARSFSRHATMTTPKRGYGHRSSPQSNSSARTTTPLQQFRHRQTQHQQAQQRSTGFGVSPTQQTGISPQNNRSGRRHQAFNLLSPQQRQNSLQAIDSGNTGNWPRNHAQIQKILQNAQPLQPGFNMGVTQQSHNAMVQVPSNTPTPTRTLYNNGGRSTPAIVQTRMMSDSIFNDFMDFAANNWMFSENPRAANFHGSLQHGNAILQMMGNQGNVDENRAGQQPTLSHEYGVSSHPTPVPQVTFTRRTPAPAEPRKLACVNCYQHWWENECDGGELCSNCMAEGQSCKRQRCFNFAAGTCNKGSKCLCVHEGDKWYQHDGFLVEQLKSGKRPQRVGKKTEAIIAPILRQRGWKAGAE